VSTFGRCHNMRGVDIHDTTADLHLLFEDRDHLDFTTIGICDGGNEIGAGTISWPRLKSIIAGDHGPRIACRTATDWTILAGVSDWGAIALATATCLRAGDLFPLIDWPAQRIERLLQGAVRRGPAIDGITRRREATVDGLPFITYIQPWLHIRQQLKLDGAPPVIDPPEPAPENRVEEHP
jgi:D-glutamate cyclase